MPPPLSKTGPVAGKLCPQEVGNLGLLRFGGRERDREREGWRNGEGGREGRREGWLSSCEQRTHQASGSKLFDSALVSWHSSAPVISISQLYPANKKGTVAHFWQTTPPSPPRLLFWEAAPSECAGANVCTSKERKRAGVSDRAGILLCRGLWVLRLISINHRSLSYCPAANLYTRNRTL